MSNETWYLKVGKYKGEWDFSVGGIIGWSKEEMDEFRAMCMVAIAQAEAQFRNNQDVLEEAKKMRSVEQPAPTKEKLNG